MKYQIEHKSTAHQKSTQIYTLVERGTARIKCLAQDTTQ